MSSLYITEFDGSGNSVSGASLQVGKMPPVTTQVVAFTTSSVQSAAFNASTKFIRVQSDAVCHLVFAANPTSTTNGQRMVADSTEYFAVTPGDKVAVIGI